jgi:hypothetical protein
MGLFNWIMLGVTAVVGGAALLCLALFIALDIEIWIRRARTLRRGTYLAMLLWFNVDVWGRVVWTLVHWVS